MALSDPYITADDLVAYLAVQGTTDDDLITAACASASGWVTRHCGRDFNQTTTATARVYAPTQLHRVHVDDFHTTTDLVVKVDDADTGTYGTTWTITTDFVLEPFNGMENGRTGHPYRTVVAVGSRSFPSLSGRARVQVTAQWGWAAIPDEVVQATTILAAEVYRLKDAPLGVAGFNDFGPLRVREVPQVAMLLEQFVHPRRSAFVG